MTRMDYDVVWDGSHQGRNRDLLFVAQHPIAVPPPRGTWKARRQGLSPETLVHCAVLSQLLSEQAMTKTEIRERLQWTPDQTQHRLETLQRMGENVQVVRRIVDARGKLINVYRVFPQVR